jgi:hypothetical protein
MFVHVVWQTVSSLVSQLTSPLRTFAGQVANVPASRMHGMLRHANCIIPLGNAVHVQKRCIGFPPVAGQVDVQVCPAVHVSPA